MAIRNVAMNAYQNAQMGQGVNRTGQARSAYKSQAGTEAGKAGRASFSQTMNESLTKVNDLQAEKESMIEEFASGERQNVHELMISLQKAGLAMRMTSAVRNKVLEAYKELSRMSF